MAKVFSTDALHRSAALLTWAAVGGFTLYLAWQGSADSRALLPVLVPILLVNLGSMWAVISDRIAVAHWRYLALWLQLASAFLLAWTYPVGFLPILTIIWISIAVHVWSFRTCVVLLPLILLVWYLVFSTVGSNSNPLISVLLYGTFHLFALLAAYTAFRAEAARAEVESLNRDLLATQHLLAEASRQSERSRIARDLHDLLGHHLTALSINLQIAERLSEGEAQEKVAESRALARLLLSDVRDAVSTLRDDDELDLANAVRLVVGNVPDLPIDLHIDESLQLTDVGIAGTLLRCIQEGVTNTLRHAGATRGVVRLERRADSVELTIHDDGRVGDLAEGNGLKGMRERVAELAGEMTIDRLGGALRLRVRIPVAG